MTYRGLELKLREAMESAIESGWAPAPVIPISAYGRCCAIGAVVVDGVAYCPGDGLIFRGDVQCVAAKRLGVDFDDLTWIWRGFDARSDYAPNGAHQRKLCDIGARIRRDYCEWT